MTRHQFSYLLGKLQCANPHGVALKDIADTIHNANKRELQNFLEILNTTYDMELQVKLISILAVYLVSNGTHTDVIVSCKRLYDRIQDILSRGLPIKTAKTLNFVSALLSIDDQAPQRRSLALYARNMIRVSGCLSTMSHLFTGCMMYQDTWIALCQCLAEACRGSEVNQSYCSHLVPLCVKKCYQDNAEVLTLLQNLLNKHERNIQLFLESDGISIFTRVMLQYDICMQLLNTVVETSTMAVALLRETNVVQHLEDFLNSYGPYSQIGQWSTIILYHLGSRSSGSEDGNTAANINKNENKIKNTTLIEKDTQGVEDTVHLFQNVMKEIVNWQSQNEFNFKKPFDILDKRLRIKINKNTNERTPFTNNFYTSKLGPQNSRMTRNEKSKTSIGNLKADYDRELSFSFLLQNDQQKVTKSYAINEESNFIYSICEENSLIPQGNLTKNGKMLYASVYRSKDASKTKFNETSERPGVINLSDFKPTFASTPKNRRQAVNRAKVSPTSQSKSATIDKNYTKARKIYKQKKYKDTVSQIKEMKNRSLSARLFSAINDSCTTLVKSVKSIFRTKENTENQEVEATEHNVENITICSYSFTNYMRKRDAVLNKDRTVNQNTVGEFSTENSCRTCNDTVILKHKLANDKFLKQTLKKLKLGINLYGCDFKKISKALWPRERYMTPNTLYNLYRKLIVKE